MAADFFNEFLIQVGYFRDIESERKFFEKIHEIHEKGTELGKRLVETASKIHESMVSISDSLAILYLKAQGLDTTAKALDALSYSAEQAYGDVNLVMGSFQQFSTQKIDFPGFKDLFTKLTGIDWKEQNSSAENFVEGLEVLQKKYNAFTNEGQRAAFLYQAEILGYSRRLFGGSRAEKLGEFFKEGIEREGVKLPEVVKQAYEARVAVKTLEDSIHVVGEKLSAQLFSDYKNIFLSISNWIDENAPRLIKLTSEILKQLEQSGRDLKAAFDLFFPPFKIAWEALMEIIHLITGNDTSGINGLRYAFDALFAVSILTGLSILGATLAAALGPLATFASVIIGLARLVGFGGAAAIAGTGIAGMLGYMAGGPSGTTGSGGVGVGGGSTGRGFNGGSSGATGSSLTTEEQKQSGIDLMNALIKRGWTPASAAIMAGNAQTESGFKFSAAGDPGIPGGSHDLMQWNRERWLAFQNFKASHAELTGMELRAAFIDWETKHTSHTSPGIREATDLSNARKFSYAYEGYGIEGSRVANAKMFLDLYNKRKNKETLDSAAKTISNMPSKLSTTPSTSSSTPYVNDYVKSLSGKPLGHDKTSSLINHHDERSIDNKTNIIVNGMEDKEQFHKMPSVSELEIQHLNHNLIGSIA